MFSIVIPVYNKANTLQASIESVLRQTVDDWEMIIVDDGSKDCFEVVVEPYLYDPRIHVIRKKNAGVSAARNDGMAVARGKYICFLDADDEWMENHLEQLSFMTVKYPVARLFCTGIRIISQNGYISSTADVMIHASEAFLVPDFFAYYDAIGGKSILITSAVCITASVIEEVGGFQPGVRIGEDYDLWLRIAAFYPIALSNVVTIVYHHEFSTATSQSTMAIDWYFQNREMQLLSDERISIDKRKNLIKYMDHFRIRKCRHLLMAGRRKEAIAVYVQIKPTRMIYKACIVTLLCLFVPKSILNNLYIRKTAKERYL